MNMVMMMMMMMIIMSALIMDNECALPQTLKQRSVVGRGQQLSDLFTMGRVYFHILVIPYIEECV